MKRLPREVREKQILDAAVDVFGKNGYHYASMDEISDVAGVSKPMIYAYLGAKEDLFAACIRRESHRLIEAISVDIHPELPPDMQLWAGLRSFFRFVGEHQDSWRILHRQAASQGRPFNEGLVAMRTRAIQLVHDLVVRSATEQGLDEYAHSGAEAMAAALVGASESMADWWLDHPGVPTRVVTSWLMNLVWLGFGELIGGEVWTPTE